MKLLFLFTLVFSNAEKYPMGNYIKNSSEIDIDNNKLCAFATYKGIFESSNKH
jgi:hypothetical protein